MSDAVADESTQRKLRSLPFLLGLPLAGAVELATAWAATTTGRSFFIVWLLMGAETLIFASVLPAWHYWATQRRTSLRPNGGYLTLVLALAGILFAGGAWSIEGVLPLKVLPNSQGLQQVARCRLEAARVCPRPTKWELPGLGAFGQADVLPADGQVVFSAYEYDDADSPADGYAYAPGVTSLRDLTVPPYSCVRHVLGSWWAFRYSPMPATGCPFGYAFVTGP